MGPKRMRGGGSGGAIYSSTGATIVDASPRGSSSTPGWESPPPPVEPLSASTKRALRMGSTDFLTRLRWVRGVVNNDFPNENDDQIKLTPRVAKLIQKNSVETKNIGNAVRELVDYSRRATLTEEQKSWLKTHLSFLAVSACKRHQRRIRAEMTLTHEPGMEMFTQSHDDDGDPIDPECMQCYDCHTPDESCSHLLDYGPSDPDLATAIPFWANHTGMIYVGTRETLYLPEQVGPGNMYYNVIRNLGIVEWGSVTYPVGVIHPFIRIDNPKYRLKNLLEMRFSKAGRGLHVPLLIEFFPSADSKNDPFGHHFLGFLIELQSVQHLYKGPVVVVMVMPSPDENSVWEDYVEHKKQYLKDLKVAYALGDALGIPVMNLEIFEVPTEPEVDTLWFYRSRNWARESLFGGQYLEVKTREYMRRFYAALKDISSALDSVDYDHVYEKVFSSPEN
jgi:hypothetical protein